MKIMSKIFLIFFSLLICSALWQTSAWADEIGIVSREIINKFQDAIIRVKIVIEVYESEKNIEALATIIDPSGLAVLSLSSLDPSGVFGLDMYKSAQSAKVKDVKMLLPDNNEISAKVVLRDQDLDLVFIRPIEQLTEPLFALDLANNTVPDIMDQILILSRFGSIAGYVPSASVGRIQGVVEKPRKLYMPDPFMGILSRLGTPVFSLDGKVLGILLLKVKKTQDFKANEIFGGMGGIEMLSVILPAEEILEVMKKVPELKE